MGNGSDIQFMETSDLHAFSYSNPDGIVVIMPCIDQKRGLETAHILSSRAGTPCKILVIYDLIRQGFIKTLNETANCVLSKYIVYLAQDAYPGRYWLQCAHETLEKSGKSLLAFNDGKWRGRIASFGMVRTEWAKLLYGGPVFYPGYTAHKADNELTVIARVQRAYIYNPECTLVEYDPHKVFNETFPEDKRLFFKRFISGFDGLVPPERLKPLSKEYFVPWESLQNSEKTTKNSVYDQGVSIVISPRGGAKRLDQLLSTFLLTNTYTPIEWIILDHDCSEHVTHTTSKYAANTFIRYLKPAVLSTRGYSWISSLRYGVSKARYPYLLFLNKDTLFPSDILDEAVDRLEKESSIVAVAMVFHERPIQTTKTSSGDDAACGLPSRISALICRTLDFMKAKGVGEASKPEDELRALCSIVALEADSGKICLWRRFDREDSMEFLQFSGGIIQEIA